MCRRVLSQISERRFPWSLFKFVSGDEWGEKGSVRVETGAMQTYLARIAVPDQEKMIQNFIRSSKENQDSQL